MSNPSTRQQPEAFETAYPEALRRRELALVRDRRRAIGISESFDQMVGVGLSGGGIRSATFALGLFQGMAKKRLLRQIDYLSTVSGGGYFGSFFGRLLSRDYVRTPEDVEAVLLGEKEPEVLEFLRENGNYLAPNGASDSLLFGAAILRNWVSIHLVLSFFIVAVFFGLQSLRGLLEINGISLEFPQKADDLIWWSPLLWLPLLSFVVAIPIGWAYWLVEPQRLAISKADRPASSTAQEVSAIPPFAGLVLVFVVSLCLAIVTRYTHFAWLWSSLVAVSVLTFVVWKLAQWKLPDQRTLKVGSPGEKMDQSLYRNHAMRNRLGLWVTGALIVTALLLGLAVVDSLGQSVYAVLKGDSTLGAWLTAIFSSLGVLAGFSRWISMFFSKGPKAGRPSLPMKWIASLAALIIVLLVLVTLNAGSHAVAFGLEIPQGAPHRLTQGKSGQISYTLTVAGAGSAGLQICREEGKECTPTKAGAGVPRDPWRTFLGFAICLLLSVLFGQTWPFVNRSSHQPLYGARLTRAYLGASNPKRRGRNLTEPVEGDDTDLARYWPPPADNGMPIHLINVTINETIAGQSQVQQQDRKGIGMALGPWGLSAGVRHHLVLPLGDDTKMNPEGERITEIYPRSEPGESIFRVFDYPEVDGRARFAGEALPLGTWLSVSGAAFSTGTGMQTSLGLSLLAGFGNVRLGRWWDSGVMREKQAKRKISLRLEDMLARLFPVQVHLLDEFLARFPGTARRHWYLSDGGHFENMGGYELLRRRLPFVVIVDGEMDADSTFEGLANLVRKARIDFGAEVRFLPEEDLDDVVSREVRPYVGSLEQLRRGKWEVAEEKRKGPHGRLVEADRTGISLAHAALARVTYASDGTKTWLLYIKPTLTGREPIDLLEYHMSHASFPHEPTIDQFFDEAQWESYRRLGLYIAEVLFGTVDSLVPDTDLSEEAGLLSRWDWDGDAGEKRAEGRLPSYS